MVFLLSVVAIVALLSQIKRMRLLPLALLMALFGYSAFAAGDCFPMKVGDERTLTGKRVSLSGDIFDDGFLVKRLSVKILSSLVKDGKTYYRVRYLVEGASSKAESIRFVRKDATGIWSLGEGDAGAVESLDFMLPLKVGVSWKRSQEMNDRTTRITTATVVGLQTVGIGGVSYKDCYHIRTNSEDGTVLEDFWLSPDVGYVKSEKVLSDGDKAVLTLEEFKPGK